ncbi:MULTISPECIES: sugar MFS transporter [Asticcacaulis]|uniref:sugar MFS transporter n=1 Tax=Asticcacaulis TaxID=76890 RepID=UPI001AE8AF0D|nr:MULTISPECIES: sugar MFS transporter [Asticcacaulis]MBP2160855.1 glucose/galactose transporter [Asticcacaulis solisilvae]MDR6801941.1 glucose/galactose transporter [Asticcacaulis sp. BE141]
MPVTPSTTASGAAPQKTPWGAVLLFCLLFFIFGFVTWLNGPLITFAQVAFNVSDSVALLVPSVFYLSYFFLSIPAALLLKKTGMKRGMAVGLVVMAIGAACFAQFASGRHFPGTLTSLFVIGGGLSILQTASNPYISVLGPIDSAAQRIAVLGMFNKGAGFLAPIVVGTLILHGIGDLAAQVESAADPAARDAILTAFAARIHMPYLGMAAFLVALAVFVWFSPLPALGDDANPDSGKGSGAAILQMLFGFLAIFFYVGAEVMAGDAITTYGNSFGLPLDVTKYFTSATLVAMIVGYIVGLITIPRFISQEKYLTWSAILGIVLTVGAFLTKGYVSVGFVAALGFANAMMWPAIFPLGIKGLGKLTELGSAFLVMGIAGGGVIMSLYGVLKQHYDFQLVFMALMVPCYAYILFFSLFAGAQGKKA